MANRRLCLGLNMGAHGAEHGKSSMGAFLPTGVSACTWSGWQCCVPVRRVNASSAPWWSPDQDVSWLPVNIFC